MYIQLPEGPDSGVKQYPALVTCHNRQYTGIQSYNIIRAVTRPPVKTPVELMVELVVVATVLENDGVAEEVVGIEVVSD